MAAEEAEAEADAAVDLHALERDVGGLALDDAGDVEDDDAGSYGSADDEETPADAFLSLQMVCAKNFPPDFLRDEARDAESLACAVERLEHVRLDRCGLVSLLGPGSGSGLPGSSTAPSLTAETTISSAPLRSLRNVSSLYLQKNRLVDLGGAINAETTPRLRFLALADNALAFDDTHDIVCFEKGDATKTHPLRGLETLPALMYLDCSGNVRLNGVAPLLERLPSSVAFCDFSRCALSFVDEYRPALVASFDALKQLDGVAVTRQERRDARALLGEEGDGDADRDGSESAEAEAEAEAEEAEEAEEAASSSSADPDASSSKPPRRARPSSNSSAAAAAAAALAMSDEDEHGSDASIEPVTEAELEAELAALERETHAARAALDADAVGDGDVFFSRDAGGIEPARLLERDRAANRAAARLEETRDALVDVEARVRHAKKQTREARESAFGSEEV